MAHAVFGHQCVETLIPTVEEGGGDGSEHEQTKTAGGKQGDRPAFFVECEADDGCQCQHQPRQKPQLLADGIAVQGEVVEHE